jgi:hypothetical protein
MKVQKEKTQKDKQIQGFMVNTKQNKQKSDQFKTIKAAVDNNRMTVDQANELILQHSKRMNRSLL